jgi:uncharacterized protein YbaA (DUF1428 family)
MSGYVDGFVLCVPKKNLKAYKKMAELGCEVWMDHGALDYQECVAHDMDAHGGVPFPKLAKPKKGEVVIFSYIRYKSRKHRDAVNKKVMKDKRLEGMCDDKKGMPFDMKRMTCGGFEVIVSAD